MKGTAEPRLSFLHLVGAAITAAHSPTNARLSGTVHLFQSNSVIRCPFAPTELARMGYCVRANTHPFRGEE
jgi:hypothetical protein